jgi:hypothetical protein
MNRLVITVFALTLGASCGEKKEQPVGGGSSQGGSPSAALTCAQVADKAVGGLGPGGGPVKEKLRPIYEKRCTDDKWPAEVMECFAKAEGMPALKKCRLNLPEVAKQNLIDQIGMVMNAAGGSMGRPPRGHGSDGSSGSAAPSTGSGSDAGSGSGSGSGSAKAPK